MKDSEELAKRALYNASDNVGIVYAILSVTVAIKELKSVIEDQKG